MLRASMEAHSKRPGPPNPSNLVGYDRVIFLMVLGVAFVWFGSDDFGDHGPIWFFVALGVAFSFSAYLSST